MDSPGADRGHTAGLRGPERQSTGAALRLEGVEKRYHRGEPVYALDDVSFSVPAGAYTAIMGPSGSGKTTLLNLIGALDTPTSGRVLVDERDVSDTSRSERADLRSEAIGFVFQSFNLMSRLTALENVALPLVFRGVGRGERHERAQELLDRVGLADRADHRPRELSGGQRQRVAIARALVCEPGVVLADEPTGNLDTTTGDRIMGALDSLHDQGRTVVVVTHERRVAEHAERIIHVQDGRLAETESLDGRSGPGA